MKQLWPHISSSDDAERMMIAIANNRPDGVKAQMEKGVTGATRAHHPVFYPGEITMFAFACTEGRLEAARLLYVPGMDLEQRNRNDMTPLMLACRVPWSTEFAKNERGSQPPEDVTEAENMIRWLVSIGADVNAIRDADRFTVLKFAASSGCSESIVDFLIESGAKIDGSEDEHLPALVLAARENNVGAMRSLVRHGAKLDSPCTLGWAEDRTALGVLLLERSQGYDKPEAIAYLQSLGAREWP